MSEILKIRLSARCEAAGRKENEDNYQVAENLAVSNAGFQTDKIFSLGNKGTLLLVCDGMGGMNAGEVASAIGVETIKNLFEPSLLTSEVLANDESACNYIKRAIVKADSRIKEEAQKDSAKQGMGSTAVMAWLLGQKVYVAWCGDSRCYRYNPSTGLEQLSHDHSYVQDLVDTGQLTPELAFDHPNKNIITRSLGDPRGSARPDAKVYDLRTGDVILLCSDGLSDSLRDNEIEQSISRSQSSMAECRDALWNDSYKAGWHDNVTIVLAQVVDENTMHVTPPSVTPTPQVVQPSQPEHSQATQPTQAAQVLKPTPNRPSSNSKFIIVAIVLTVVVLLIIAGFYIWKSKGCKNKNESIPNIVCSETPVTESTENKNLEEEYDVLKDNLEDIKFHTLSDFQTMKDSINRTTNIHYKKFVELDKQLNKNKASNIKDKINQAIELAAYEFEESQLREEINQLKLD